MNDFEMLCPKTLEEALDCLADNNHRQTKILAGGTDLVVRLREGFLKPDVIVDITRIKKLSEAKEVDGYVRIGAACTMSQIVDSKIVRKFGNCLVQAALEIGSEQIRNRATIGGNICNASPAADTIPALLVLEATARIESKDGVKDMPLEELLVGPGNTVLGAQEILTFISFKKEKENQLSVFFKLGKRKAQAISVVNGALALELDTSKKKFTNFRIALGSVAPRTIRLKNVEERLIGYNVGREIIEEAADLIEESISPISDIRASAAYRKKVSRNLFIKLVTAQVTK
jgi:carbon-monoxide dehydrogenase medium subunit